MGSIRTSLLTGTITGTLVVLAGAGLALDRGARRTLLAEYDRELLERAQLLASTVELTEEGIEHEFEELDMRAFETGEGGAYLDVRYRRDGEVLYRSPSLDGPAVALDSVPTEVDPSYRDLRSGSARLRAVGFHFTPRVDIDEDEPVAEGIDPAVPPVLTLRLARGTAAIDALLGRMRWLLAIVGVVSGAAALAILGTVVSRSLRPLQKLAREIAALDPDRLTDRFRADRAPEEVEPVIDQLNELLDRLESAFLRERTLSADVAHELRTPLSGLRTAVEVSLAQPRPAEGYRRALEDALTIVVQMQDVVETLLSLARLDAGLVRPEPRPVDLTALVRSSWSSLDAIAARRELDVVMRLPKDVLVESDPTLLETIVRNALTNAVTHGDVGGRVEIVVCEAERATTLEIVNSGSTVPQDRVPELLRRFRRGNEARDAEKGNAGLGLALVQKAAETVGVRVEIESQVGGSFAIRLGLKPARIRLASHGAV